MDFLRELFEKLIACFPKIVQLYTYQAGMRFTFGKYAKALGPGWYVIWPLVQEIVYMDVQSRIADLRVQSAWTKDGHDIAVSGGVRYRIADIKRAICNIDEVDEALSKAALGTILEFVNERTLSDCRDINALKERVIRDLRLNVAGWGLRIERVFITDIGKTRNIRLLTHSNMLKVKGE